MRLRFAYIPVSAALACSVAAQEKVTFQDHLLPLIEASCAKCHNADKKKGDLDLTSYSGTLAGGASGKIVVAGDPDASKVWKVINHLEDPPMPPKSSKMADKDLAVFKKWIAGGLLETLNSKAIAGRPTMDLTLGTGTVGKPDGPPPMPGDLLMEPATPVKRATAVTGLAASPWAPLIAVAGQKQVVLYNSDTLDLLGVLPFKDEQESYQPDDVKFSRNGKLLVVGGGHAAKAGRIIVFDVTTGERVISVGSGQEFDSALGADISADQTKIAFGGPSRVVKVFSTKDGSILYKMKKHTDWVTAVAFSPNGEWLATADRNGGVTVWDADNGLEVHTVAGHKSMVTGLSWRDDSKLLVSVSEDGAAKVWEMSEGKQVRTWNPHPTGTLSVSQAHDGRVVTCGRDRQMTVWSADGTKQKTVEFTNEMPVRAVFSHDGARLIATDWLGKVTVWNTGDGRFVGDLAANPPTITEQIVTAQQRLAELQNGATKPASLPPVEQPGADAAVKEWRQASNAVEKARADLAPKEAEDARLKAEVLKNRTPALEAKRAASKAVREQARAALTNALTAFEAKAAQLAKGKNVAPVDMKRVDPAQEIAALQIRIAKLKTAQVHSTIHAAKESIAAKKREHEKLIASGSKTDKSAAEKLAKAIAKEEKDLQKRASDYEKLKSASLSPALPVRQSKL